MPPPKNPLDWIDDQLAELDALGLRRQPLGHRGPQGARVEIGGRTCINFGSNDYLGLAGDPRIAAAAAEAIAHEGWGSGASPLVAGRSAAHVQLERDLAAFEGAESAIVFSSGFAANVAAISALVGRGDAVLADELNHASLIDGCRLSRAEVHVYPHNDVTELAHLCDRTRGARRRLIVTDSLFSMGGDFAPLAAIAEIAAAEGAMLMVDEAHATGVYGATGCGAGELCGVSERIDVRVGTLSKALGGIGGFVCGQRSLIEWLINRGRPYVFSTAPPPAACAAASAALRIVHDEPARRERLQEQAGALRAKLRAAGWDLEQSASHIIPVVLGTPEAATTMAAALFERGLYVPAIRPPSVPAGTSRLRISLSASHDETMVAELTAALASLRHEATAS